jgi:hypothetical protein
LRALLALLPLVAGLTLSSAGAGCGSADCTETATCASVPDDAAPAGPTFDATSETSVPAGNDAEAAATETDDASEAGPAGDAGPTGGGDAGDAEAPGDAGDAGDSGGAGACNPSAPDCSNPQCQQDFTCTAAAPAGWFGPVALFDQSGGPPTPVAAACSGSYTGDAFDGNSNPTSPAASCGCTCGSLQGVCSNPSVTIYPDNACVPANHCGQAGAPACTVADGPSCSSGGQSAQVSTLPQPTGAGSCAAGVTQTGLPGSQWAHTGRGCASGRAFATGGCAAQHVCADKPPSSFGSSLCVWQNANTDCSAATGYPLLHKYYSGVLDTRGCALGSCGCGTPASVTCALTGVTSYTTPDCSGGGTPLGDLTVGHCNVVGNDQIFGMTTAVSASGQCTGNGSATSTGSVAADTTTAVTVCCSQ